MQFIELGRGQRNNRTDRDEEEQGALPSPSVEEKRGAEYKNQPHEEDGNNLNHASYLTTKGNKARIRALLIALARDL
jgi:hypothetical protein